MNPELKGSRTEANLMAAYAGESQARNKYIYYAEKARKDGYEQIARIFEATAANELAHAKIWFKLLHGGEIGPTLGNLQDAAGGEHFEWEEMYAGFAREAKEEGFDRIAWLFQGVAAIEKEHEARFRKLISNLKDSQVFARETEQVWICTVCGHIHTGKTAPQVCPVCSHGQGFFQIKAENF